MPEPLFPWYVVGPMLGLIVPLLLLVGNKMFRITTTFQHFCAALLPTKNIPFLQYDWKPQLWNFSFVLGFILATPIFHLLFPAHVLTFLPESFYSLEGVLLLFGGGILIGFGARYAGGCTAGTAITGLATFQFVTAYGVLSFFGSAIITSFILGLLSL